MGPELHGLQAPGTHGPLGPGVVGPMSHLVLGPMVQRFHGPTDPHGLLGFRAPGAQGSVVPWGPGLTASWIHRELAYGLLVPHFL